MKSFELSGAAVKNSSAARRMSMSDKMEICVKVRDYADKTKKFYSVGTKFKLEGSSGPCDSVAEVINTILRMIPRYAENGLEVKENNIILSNRTSINLSVSKILMELSGNYGIGKFLGIGNVFTAKIPLQDEEVEKDIEYLMREKQEVSM